MDSYYEELLPNIKTLMDKEQIKEAFTLINEELSLPYVPSSVESTLKELQEECRLKLQEVPKEKAYDEDQLKQLLKGNSEEQWKAVNYLRTSNIRNFLELIEDILCGNTDRMIKSALIEAMIAQNVSDEIRMIDEGMEIQLIPCYIDLPTKAEGAIAAHDYLCEWFENEDPSFLQLSLDSLLEEVYLMLPLNVEREESEMIAHAIAKYLFRAIGFEQNYEPFRQRYHLPKKITYDPLFCKRQLWRM